MSLKVLFVFTAFNFIIALDFTCPSGSVKSTTSNVCYTFSTTPTTFIQAQVHCTEQGGNLVDVDSQITNMLLIANVASRNWQDFWIGATLTKVYNDAGMVKIWIWEGLDKIVKYDDWGFNEPSNKGGCAAVKASDGTWFADDCSTTKNYVCSIPVKLDVCDNEWIYFPVTKFCYKVFFHADYNAAESNCVVLGAHLVSIHSKEEDVFVQDISQCGINFGNDGGEATLIGLYEVGSDGTKWNWTDGSPTNYVPWTPPEPNFVSTDKCTSVYADPTNGALTGYWNNMPCSWQMRNYVCKKSPIAVEIK